MGLMSNKLNMIDFVANQGKERYKHFIVYGPACKGKTKAAKKLVDKTGAIYMDLLDDFVDDSRLKDMIDTFDLQDFKKYLKNKDNVGSLLIIDNMDFLLNTWDESQWETFLKFVEWDEVTCVYGFIMQDRKGLADADFINSQGQKRAINIFDMQ